MASLKATANSVSFAMFSNFSKWERQQCEKNYSN